MVHSKMEMRIQILVGFSISADYRAFLSTARLGTLGRNRDTRRKFQCSSDGQRVRCVFSLGLLTPAGN